jgi:hypothetical protein
VHSGAFVEDESQSGYSHLLEHMLFKANELQPDPEAYRSELERLGISSNAFTGRDLVGYHFVLPTKQRDAGMQLFAASLRAPSFDQTSLETEISVVLAEFDRAEADPDRHAQLQALELLFDRPETHPLSRQRCAALRAGSRAQRGVERDRHAPQLRRLCARNDAGTDRERSRSDLDAAGVCERFEPRARVSMGDGLELGSARIFAELSRHALRARSERSRASLEELYGCEPSRGGRGYDGRGSRNRRRQAIGGSRRSTCSASPRSMRPRHG